MFGVSCIKCGEENCIRVNLSDLDNFICEECDAEFKAEELERIIGEWQAVLRWTAAAKQFADGGSPELAKAAS